MRNELGFHFKQIDQLLTICCSSLNQNDPLEYYFWALFYFPIQYLILLYLKGFSSLEVYNRCADFDKNQYFITTQNK